MAFSLCRPACDSAPSMTGSPIDMRAEEGDETVDELADEAAKTKKQLREHTETGKQVQEGTQDTDRHEV
jgi:hypothetical protein